MYWSGTPVAAAFCLSVLAFGNSLENFCVYLEVFVLIPRFVLNPTYADGSLKDFLPKRVISFLRLTRLRLDRPEK